MAIDFTVGDNVVINRAYVEQILPSVDGVTLQTTVSLGYIGANPSEVLETGSVAASPSVTLSFIRVRPQNTSNPAYQRAAGTIIYFPSDAILNNSFELSTSYIDDKQFVMALNSTGSTITKGQVVRQTGFDATQQVPIIAPANATTTADSAVLGLASADILTTELGSIILTGAFEGLDTSSFSSVGAEVFLSDTPGAIATAAGTVGAVVGRALSIDATNGSISLVTSLGGGSGGGGGGGFFTDGAGTNATIGKGASAPTADGVNSFSHGNQCESNGENAFAQGDNCRVGNGYAHCFAQGFDNAVNDDVSFAQGYDNYIGPGDTNIMTQGSGNTINSSENVFTQGESADAGNAYQCVVQGYESVCSDGNQVFIQGQTSYWNSDTVENIFSQGIGIYSGGSAYQVLVQGRDLSVQGGANNLVVQGRDMSGLGSSNTFMQGQGHSLNAVSRARAFIQGAYAQIKMDDQKVWGSNRTSPVGGAQSSKVIKHLTRTDATLTALVTVVTDTDKSYCISAKVSARNTITNAESATWTLSQALVYNDAGTAVLVGSPTFTQVDSGGGATGWTCAIAVTTSEFRINIASDASDTVQWCCDLEFVEVAG